MSGPVHAEYEYIVIGLGGLGSGAVYWLARRAGDAVLGLEQFALGHDRGASQDHSRIFRISYDQPEYAALARHSYEAWRAVEAEAAESLLVITGGLDLFPPGGDVSPVGHVQGLTALGIPFEQLDAGQIMRRFPQFKVDEGTVGLYQSQGGIAPAAKCNRTHQALARAHGATLRDNTPVTGVRALPDGMEVTTPDAIYRCRKLIVTADAWTNQVLAPLGVRIPLISTQEQVAYYAAPDLDAFRPGRFPSWIWYDVPCYYGLAVYGEERGVKVAQDIGGEEITTETRTFEPNQKTLDRVGAFMRQHMPGAMGPIVSLKTCIYTLTPDRDFVIDTLPGYPQVAIGLGAAHGFKFASIIGRVLSDLAIDGRSEYSSPKFAASRAILREENPPRMFQSFLDKNKLPVLV